MQQWGGLSTAAIWTPTKWFNAEVGGRADLLAFRVRDLLRDGTPQNEVLFHLSPRVLLTFKLGGGWRVFASYGRGLRPPEARAANKEPGGVEDAELDRFTGGTSKITATDSAEIGTRWAVTHAMDVGLSAFGTWIDSETVFDHVSGFNLALNSTQRLGLEFDVTWYPTAWLQIDGDFSVVDAKFIDSGEPVPGVPTMIGRLQTWFGPLAGWSAGVRLTGLGARPLAFGATAAPGVMLDISANYRWEWLEAGLQMSNALNTDWRAGEYNFASWWDQSRSRSQLPAIHIAAGTPWTLRGQMTFWF